MDGDKSVSKRSRSRQFFFRGLAIILPTVLTVWILLAAYQFVQGRIAAPINTGIQSLVVRFTDWPPPTDADFDVAAEHLTVAQRDAWNVVNEEVRRSRGADYGPKQQVDQRRAWMKSQPEIVMLARREALAEKWNAIAIGNWRIMDLIGLVVAVILIYIIGALLGSFIGKRLYSQGEELVGRVPLISKVYPSVKQVTDFFVGEEREQVSFNRVVAVEYPRRGIWSVGLVTGDTMRGIQERVGEQCLTVFIPSSPTPFTGYVITVPAKDTIDLNVNIEEALKFAVSLGVLVPPGQKIHVDEPRIDRAIADAKSDVGAAGGPNSGAA